MDLRGQKLAEWLYQLLFILIGVRFEWIRLMRELGGAES